MSFNFLFNILPRSIAQICPQKPRNKGLKTTNFHLLLSRDDEDNSQVITIINNKPVNWLPGNKHREGKAGQCGETIQEIRT